MRAGEHGENQRLASRSTIPGGSGNPNTMQKGQECAATPINRGRCVHVGTASRRTELYTNVHGKTLRMSFRDAAAVRPHEFILDEFAQFAGMLDEVTEGTTCERHRRVLTLVHNMAVVIECGFQLVEWGVYVNRSGEIQTHRNMEASTKEQGVRTVRCCATRSSQYNMDSPSSRFLSLVAPAHRWDGGIGCRSKKKIHGHNTAPYQ